MEDDEVERAVDAAERARLVADRAEQAAQAAKDRKRESSSSMGGFAVRIYV